MRSDTATDTRSDAASRRRRFTRRFVVFMAVNVVLLTALVAAGNAVGQRKKYALGWNASVLQVIGRDQHYRYLVMGPSHAYSFAWGGNQDITQEALGGRTTNIGINAAGPYVEDIYLDMFLRRGNTADTVVYFAHPFSFYSASWNEDNRFVGREPLDWDFLKVLTDHGIGEDMLFFFFAQSKVSPTWLQDGPAGPIEPVDTEVGRIDPDLRQAGTERLYPSGTDPPTFDRYWKWFRTSLAKLRARGTKVLVVIQPTLVERLGFDHALQRFGELAGDPGVAVLDTSQTCRTRSCTRTTHTSTGRVFAASLPRRSSRLSAASMAAPSRSLAAAIRAAAARRPDGPGTAAAFNPRTGSHRGRASQP